MTATEVEARAVDRPEPTGEPVGAEPEGKPVDGPTPTEGTPNRLAPLTRRRVLVLVGGGLVLAVLSLLVVAYALGPMLHQRSQRSLLRHFREEVRRAAAETQGLGGVTVPTKAPSPGDGVAILEIGRLHLQQVVVEGVGSAQTRAGPGHVPGTAGAGQPGNAVIVGRRAAYGAPFHHLSQLQRGDSIVVTTTQGRSVYRVTEVGDHQVRDRLYAPTRTDQLTLLTSASGWPLASGRATVVVAEMRGVPFQPTPQGGRTGHDDGRHGDSSALPLLMIVLVGYAGVLAGAILLYRRWSALATYLLTAPALVALAILLTQAVSQLLPPWA